MSFHLLRPRIASQPVVSAASGTLTQPLPARAIPTTETRSGAGARIMAGIFGRPNNPATNLSAEVSPYPGKQGLYSYHEGDLFTPGSQNWVFTYPFEFPMQTIWGHAFLRKPNTFDPQQPQQVFSQPNVVINGIGGLVAGTFVMQGLETEDQ